MYQQQIRWFSKQGKDVCPRDQILVDLTAQVDQWLSKGNIIIILADINNNVQTDPIRSTFQQMGLVEAVTSQHGLLGPNTHNHSTNPIDGIFIPPLLLTNVMSRYFSFGEGIPSDHRALWIDIPLAALGWFTVPESIPLKAWRLKCNDPRIIKKYIEALELQLDTHQLPQRIELLTPQTRHNRLTRQQKWDYKEIDCLSSDAKHHAETKCHKLMVGRVQWCPQLTRAIAQILYWKGLRKRHTGRHIGAQHLHHLAKKGGIMHSQENLQLEIITVETHI